MNPLLPLYALAVDAETLAAAARLGARLTAVLPAAPGRVPAVTRLAAAGASLLGRVDLAYGQRPLAVVLAEVRAWAAYPTNGVFLDRAPGDPEGAGPVALAVRVARRAGLTDVTLNPGAPPHPVYREWDARICVFDGPWARYADWAADGARPGDGHLVYGVPPAELPRALALAAGRGAGFGLVTDRPHAGPDAAGEPADRAGGGPP
jgi:hypothetical protein